MRSFAIVLRREFVERRNVIFTALAASLIPILIPLLPSVPGDARVETRTLLAQNLALIFAAGVAITSGVSLFSRDLVEGRASFFFSRPIGQTSIWAGKIVAGIVLVFATLWIIMLPSLAIDPEGWKFDKANLTGTVGIPIVAGLLLLLLGNAAGVMVRSRKLLVLGDFVLVVIAGAAGWGLFIHYAWLTSSGGFAFILTSAYVVAVALVLVLLAGSWQQTYAGRVDIARAHRALSFTIWPIVFGLLAIFAAFVWWLPRVDPADLVPFHGVRTGNGAWISVAGEASSRPAAYTAGMIVDARNPERYIRLEGAWHPGSVEFSRDGRWAAWPRGDKNLRGHRYRQPSFKRVPERHLALAELDGTPAVRHTDIRLETSDMVFSDDGRRLAIRGLEQVTVYDTETLNSVGSVQVSAPHVRMFFMPDGALRLLLQGGGDDDITLLAWNPAHRGIEKTGVLAAARSVAFDEAGARVLVVAKDSITLRDGRTGALTAELLRWSDGVESRARGTFLTDGRVIVSRSSKEGNVLRLFAADGTAPRDIPLPRSRWLLVNEEVSPGVVLVRAGDGNPENRSIRTLAVDLQSGRVTHVLDDTVPVSSWRQFDTDPRVQPESDVVALWNMRTTSLQRLDLATWKTVPIFDRTN